MVGLLFVLTASLLPSSLAPQTPPERRATEVAVLGGLDAPEHLVFERAPSLLLTATGDLIVVDRSVPTVTRVDGDGALIRRIGAEGEGPGEFTVPHHLGFIGDTLWIVDVPAMRLLRFGPDGAHVGQQNLPTIDYGFPTTARTAISSLLDGGFAVAAPGGYPIGVPGRVQMPVLHGTLGEKPPSTEIASLTVPNGLRVDGVGVFNHRPLPIPPVFVPDPYGRGFAVLDWDATQPEAITLSRFAANGEATSRTLVPHRPVPLTPEQRSKLIDDGVAFAASILASARRSGQVRDSDRDLVEAGLPLSDHAPPMRSAFIDRDGRLWTQEWTLGPEAEWSVLDSDGGTLFRVVLPSDLTLETAGGDTLWATRLGEFDEPYLVRLSLGRIGQEDMPGSAAGGI